MLGLSIDIQDDLDDELLSEIHGMRFIAEEGFARRYGEKFSISLQENGLTLAADTLPNLGKSCTA